MPTTAEKLAALLGFADRMQQCSITFERPEKPVSYDGLNWYNRRDVRKWVEKQKTDPMTRAKVSLLHHLTPEAIAAMALGLKSTKKCHSSTKDFVKELQKKIASGEIDRHQLYPLIATPKNLYFAAKHGDITAVTAFCGAGVNVNATHAQGATALYIACQQGHANVAKYLLAQNANPGLTTDTGVSPLYIASDRGHAAVVRVLLAGGADRSISWQGTTPLQAAKSLGHHAIVAEFNRKPRRQLSCETTLPGLPAIRTKQARTPTTIMWKPGSDGPARDRSDSDSSDSSTVSTPRLSKASFMARKQARLPARSNTPTALPALVLGH